MANEKISYVETAENVVEFSAGGKTVQTTPEELEAAVKITGGSMLSAHSLLYAQEKLMEDIDDAIEKVSENYHDELTDIKEKRKITVSVDFSYNAEHQIVVMVSGVQVKLAKRRYTQALRRDAGQLMLF